MTLTQSDLVRRLRSTPGLTLIEARRAVHDVTSALTDLLDQLNLGDRLTLKYLGHFECYLRKGGLRHGLHGREPMTLPDRPSLRFHANAQRRASLAARLGMREGSRPGASVPHEPLARPTMQPIPLESPGTLCVPADPPQPGDAQ
jgi:nucleoid DNA-binding protein